MKTFDIRCTEDYVTEDAVQAGKTPLVPEGSVLMVVRSGILRRYVPVAVACRAVTVNQDLKAMVVKDPGLSSRFLAVQIAGNQHALLTAWRKLGATVESLEHGFIANTTFLVPPMEEQENVLDAIDDESDYIDQAVQRARREIELIREYRVRLISDVVTGKLDVRGVELPEAGEEGEGVVAGLGGLESIATEGSPDPEEAQDAALRHQ